MSAAAITAITGAASARPPSFEEARSRRQKARAVGLDPDYWYPVERSENVARGQVVEVVFWKRSIALYRGDDGVLRAVEDRCAHRQLKLSKGVVCGGEIACGYHGWRFAGDGRLASVPHDLCGQRMPKVTIGSYPVKERYGLVWLFPGDGARAAERSIPRLPELEPPGSRRFASVVVDMRFAAHHSMMMENVCDFTHGWLHRSYRPFSIDAKLTRCEAEGDTVHVAYDTDVGRGRVTQLFIDRDAVDTGSMRLAYEYPYQWSNTGDRIKSWFFPLPEHERSTRGFFVFAFDHFKVPLLPLHMPRPVMKLVLAAASELHIKPLLRQDAFAVEAEQEGYDAHFAAPHAELNPVVHEFQKLNVRKWEEHLARTSRG